MAQVVIVGAGPAGAALALLLVRRGIAVTLVEVTKDFHRVFRGEGLMPSGLDALQQMGLSEVLEQIPHRPLDAWEFIVGDTQLFRVEEPMGSSQPCTLVSQPPLLEALIAEAQPYEGFEFVQGVAVKDLVWSCDGQRPALGSDRIIGVKLANGREIAADLVIGTDGRNSIIRQRAGLELVKQPQDIGVLWFKLAAHPRFVEDNVFCTILKGDSGFSVFHGAEAGKLHLAWVLFAEDKTDRKQANWAEVFAASSPDWLAEHFRNSADTIEPPIRLSVVVGRCPSWHKPGVLLLGDAAHPMSPVRAQGINLALRDVIVAANYLVPVLMAGASPELIDQALGQIQAEREPEIIRAQQLQQREAGQGDKLRKNRLARALIMRLAPLFRRSLRQVWVKRQHDLREGVTSVRLVV
ncbi:FAD-dependent monooxygenase [Pseudanabaena sp. FACHB-2040]|uniref:FAD-dependent monooxygenase n=1 Tax=Pseudanabaena sp. FACHB-2040 TaxID=2692859 RepID=UPI00168A115A|nr:FAD-dependent monooxygenase [Pseudanabaena sp. FACHB-2040]MBD2259558.1 FAD-dependent monooxygenase [Pseudanabaena sp. FACHB-2040]